MVGVVETGAAKGTLALSFERIISPDVHCVLAAKRRNLGIVRPSLSHETRSQPTACLHGFTALFRLRDMPHSGLSSTQGDEASASAGGLPSDPEEFLLQEAEDNGSVPASPILLLPRFPSECRPPNAPLMPRAVLPLHVVRSGHRTRGHAAKARPLPAVEYPPGKGDGYYGSSHLTGQHAALQTPLFVSLPTALARNRTSARRMS